MFEPMPALKPTGAAAARLSGWQRWEMTSIAPREAVSAAAAVLTEPLLAAPPLPEQAPVIDAAELVRLRELAQQAGQHEGYQDGYAQGLAEGQAAGLREVQAQAQALAALVQSLPEAMRAAQDEVAEDLMALALDIAHQVVHQTLTNEPQHILTLVHELLRMEPALNGTPRLLMHVDDAALVQQHLADDLHAAGWRVRTDLSITRGGCRVHAASGALDATLETRWERVAAAFRRDFDHSRQVPHG